VREHKTIEELNAAWSTRLKAFTEVLPPRPPLQQAQNLRLAALLETWIDDYLEWLARRRATWACRCRSHNEQGTQHSPLHAQHGPAHIDFIGLRRRTPRPRRVVHGHPSCLLTLRSSRPTHASPAHAPTELGTGWSTRAPT